MTTFTVEIPFDYAHRLDPATPVIIPVKRFTTRLADEIARKVSDSRFDESSSAVRTTIEMASAAYAHLKALNEPDEPALEIDAATSSASYEALLAEASRVADAAAPTGMQTSDIRFVGEVGVEQDLRSGNPFVESRWTGHILVTWAENGKG